MWEVGCIDVRLLSALDKQSKGASCYTSPTKRVQRKKSIGSKHDFIKDSECAITLFFSYFNVINFYVVFFCIVGLDNTDNALNAMNVSTKKTIKRRLKKKTQKVRTNEK